MRRADRSRRANPMLGAAKSADVRMAGVSQSARGETTRRMPGAPMARLGAAVPVGELAGWEAPIRIERTRP